MTSDNKGVPNLGAVFSKLTRRSESKSDSAPPSPVVGLRKAVSGETRASTILASSASDTGPHALEMSVSNIQMPCYAEHIGMLRWVFS